MVRSSFTLAASQHNNSNDNNLKQQSQSLTHAPPGSLTPLLCAVDIVAAVPILSGYLLPDRVGRVLLHHRVAHDRMQPASFPTHKARNEPRWIPG